MADPTVTHARNLRTNGADATLVRPAEWNADHTFTAAGQRLLGRTTAGAGAIEEITVSPGGQFASGVLSLVAGLDVVQADTFTANGTWNKASGALLVLVICVGGGAGGMSGNVQASTYRLGGAAGGPGQLIAAVFPAAALSASESVTVGAAASGGAASTTSTFNAGTQGNPSSFGSRLLAYGGNRTTVAWRSVSDLDGLPGYAVMPNGTNPYSFYDQPVRWQGVNYTPGCSQATGAIRAGYPWEPMQPGGGGIGGGLSGTNTELSSRDGGAGWSTDRTGFCQALTFPTNWELGGGGARGAFGVAQNAANGTSRSWPGLGDGGGGGGSNGTGAGNGGNGGDGGTPGGGGGGGGCTRTATSGAGGAGARGAVMVFQFGST